MATTTAIRKIDKFGRITIPIHVRKGLGLIEGGKLSITLNEDNKIVISKKKSLDDARILDNLGRIVIIKTLRELAGINIGDRVRLQIENGDIIVEKIIDNHYDKCIFCNSQNKGITFKNKNICMKCLLQLKDYKFY